MTKRERKYLTKHSMIRKLRLPKENRYLRYVSIGFNEPGEYIKARVNGEVYWYKNHWDGVIAGERLPPTKEGVEMFNRSLEKHRQNQAL